MKLLGLFCALLVSGLLAVGCGSSDMKPEDSIGSDLKKAGVSDQPTDSKHAGTKKAEMSDKGAAPNTPQ
ncbi:MAG: hypothetical protein JST12_17645 [Armatimonadetes bacterium]|nr:hypothetical protein [Armatimonadota bacterium]